SAGIKAAAPHEMERLSKSSLKTAFARSPAGASPTAGQKGADGPWGRLDIRGYGVDLRPEEFAWSAAAQPGRPRRGTGRASDWCSENWPGPDDWKTDYLAPQGHLVLVQA